MHDFKGVHAPGGDAWIWLACESGAIDWMDAGKGALKDGKVMKQTLEYAIKKGLVTAEEVGIKVEPPTISEEELEAYSLPEGPKFECHLQPDHFITRYMARGFDISDAYPEYWFSGGLHALAVVADKKIKMELRQGTIYTNLYIFNIGKSTLSRKSTASDKTEAMLDTVCPFLLDAKVPTEFSPEAFIEHMDEHNHAPWVRDEAAGVLSLMKRDYMRGFKDSLMQLYDCKPYHRKLRTSQRKKVKTDFRVDDPYLNLFWSTTGAGFGANTEQNDTLSGFLARFIFFSTRQKGEMVATRGRNST